MKKIHPVIDDFINTSASLEAILSKHMKGSALLTKMNRMYSGIYKWQTTDEVYEQTVYNIEATDDLDLVALYYNLRTMFALRLGKDDDAKALSNLMLSAMSKNTPIILVHFLKNIMYYLDIRTDELVAYIEKCMKPVLSPRQLVFYLNYSSILSQVGKLSKAIALPKKLESYLTEKNKDELYGYSPLSNAIETFNQSLFNKFIPIYERADQKLVKKKQLDILVSLFNLSISSDVEEKDLPKQLIPTYLLLKNRKEESLEFCKNNTGGGLPSLFLSCSIIRAELVNGNFEAALRSTKAHQNINPYMSQFYFARIEYAKGNKQKALKHFAELLRLCKYYDAQGLLDFELNLALELKPSDLRFFFENVGGVNLKEVKKDIGETVMVEGSNKNILIGKSNVISNLKKSAKQFGATKTSILITGETGVGKDVFARYLHQVSEISKQPFIAINCGAISENLIQSELFGHEAGAFTGSVKKHVGVFEAAGKGTLFLDEIGEISSQLQVTLLRALDNNEYRPVGSNKVKKFKCRLLFATNVDLEDLVRKKIFREDLLYRLKRLEIKIPPLRDHNSDIPLLVNHFLQIGRSDHGKPVCSKELMRLYQQKDWPGNIRQLKNEIDKLRLFGSEKLSYDTEDTQIFESNEKKKSDTVVGKKNDQVEENIVSDNQKLNEIEMDEIILDRPGRLRRLDRLKVLFEKYEKLTRKEISTVFKISPKTAAVDLGFLCDEGFVKRIEPSTAPRTHYFMLNQD